MIYTAVHCFFWRGLRGTPSRQKSKSYSSTAVIFARFTYIYYYSYRLLSCAQTQGESCENAVRYSLSFSAGDRARTRNKWEKTKQKNREKIKNRPAACFTRARRYANIQGCILIMSERAKIPAIRFEIFRSNSSSPSYVNNNMFIISFFFSLLLRTRYESCGNFFFVASQARADP